ncbi:green-sensitive opsin-1-like [Tubulanus polymorphus]|uniref:green-sensitive opsin-1-like n=1 Tax=Tubulanus polymorphus TaxID=672921 RepID=UPI003DA3EFD4
MINRTGPAASPACFQLLYTDVTLHIRDMRYYMAFIFPIIGLVSFVIVVLGSYKRASKSTGHFYMIVLGVADLYAIVSMQTQWLMNKFGYSFNRIECVLRQFHAVCPTQVAIWILVLMTVDRAVAVSQPLKAASLCTIKRAKVSISGAVCLLAAYNFAWSIFFKPHKHDIRTTCQIDEINIAFIYEIVVNVLSLYGPIPVIAVTNAVIISSVRKSANMQQQQQISQTAKKQDASRKITVLVVTTALVFLVSTFPAGLFELLFLEYGTAQKTGLYYWTHCDTAYGAFLLFGYEFGQMIYDVNHVINGFVYVASSQQFQKDLRAAITRS